MANNKLRVKGVNTGGGGGNLTDFISVWDTTLGDGQPTIFLPLVESGNYNFTVNWGDGNTDTITAYDQAEVTHTYATGGTYTVTITGTIEGWSFNNNNTDRDKIISITNWGDFRGTSFFDFTECHNLNLSSVSDVLNLTGVTDLSLAFSGCTSLTTINRINEWNVSSVTNMSAMFSGATLFNGNISGWNVSAVTDMSYMFEFATAFNQPLNSWDVSSVTNMNSMFASAALFNQPLNSWNVSAVTNMGYMFDSATAFNQDISGWDVSLVDDMNNMFAGTSAFNQPLNSWNVSSVTNMYNMFGASKSSYAIFNQPLNSWNVSSVTAMGGMFAENQYFNQDISAWDVSLVDSMESMFFNATAFNQDISGWDISSVTNMNNFMAGKSTADYSYYDDLLNAWSQLTLQTGVNWGMGTIEYTSFAATARQDIIDNYGWTITDGGQYFIPFVSVWDTSLGDGNPTITLPLVASGNYNFTVNWGDGNTDTITAWDQAEKTHTYGTGLNKTITITGTIEGWSFNGGGDCAKLTSITSVGPLKLGNQGNYFYGCSNLTTIGGTFDLTGVTNFVCMFRDCSSLTSVNGIELWDTSSVTDMSGVFSAASSFNQNISSWDVSSVYGMNAMFLGATSFNQPLNSWNVSNVSYMSSMFAYATSFNQDISDWNVSSVVYMPGFMAGKSTADYDYYDNLLNAWSQLTLQNGVTWGMGSIEYTSAGSAARASIISNYSWTITDGGTP